MPELELRPLNDMANKWPLGMSLAVEHDGFRGTVIGHYVTREGKRGLVLQQDGTKVVHVYGVKWFVENM